MKKIFSFLMICLTVLLFAGCGDKGSKLEPREYIGDISNFYSYGITTLEESFDLNEDALETVADASETLNNIQTVESGYFGGIYNFANFIPAVDYVSGNKTGKILYAYNFDDEFYIYSVNKLQNPQTIDGLRYTIIAVELTVDNETISYQVKVNRQKEVITVRCPKIEDGEIVLEGENQVEQRFQVQFDKSISYLQIRNVTSASVVVSYEMCFDNNDNFIYRRNVGGLVEFDGKFNIGTTGLNLMILCTKDTKNKFDFTKFNEEKFNYKNFASQTTIDVFTANISFNSEKVEEDTYDEFTTNITPSGNVSSSVKDAYVNSLISGEN